MASVADVLEALRRERAMDDSLLPFPGVLDCCRILRREKLDALELDRADPAGVRNEKPKSTLSTLRLLERLVYGLLELGVCALTQRLSAAVEDDLVGCHPRRSAGQNLCLRHCAL